MLSFDDPRWLGLQGGYHHLYDPRPSLAFLLEEKNVANVWKEFWNELHHQGDVDSASYVVVTELVRICKSKTKPDWNFYSLVSIIEIARHRKDNPQIPDWISSDYFEAWDEIVKLSIKDISFSDDSLIVRTALGALAIGKKLLRIGTLISYLDDSEVNEILDEHMAWSQQFDERR
jgi:hypothetical protein